MKRAGRCAAITEEEQRPGPSTLPPAASPASCTSPSTGNRARAQLCLGGADGSVGAWVGESEG